MQERKRTRQDTFEPHKSEYDAERKRTKRKKKSRQREREARQKDALPVAVGGSSEETWETRTTTSLDNLPVEVSDPDSVLFVDVNEHCQLTHIHFRSFMRSIYMRRIRPSQS